MLRNKQIFDIADKCDEGQEGNEFLVAFAYAIESTACAERDARIAELDRSLDVMAQNTEAQAHASLQREIELTEKVEKLTQQLAEAREDAELLDYIQTNGATVEIIPGAPDFYPVHFRVGGRYRTANENIRDAIRAAIKEQTCDNAS